MQPWIARGAAARLPIDRHIVRPPLGVDAMLADVIRHDANILDAGVVLQDGAGIEDVAAVAGHAIQQFLAALPHVVGRAAPATRWERRR